jgi:hypothetical protein
MPIDSATRSDLARENVSFAGWFNSDTENAKGENIKCPLFAIQNNS